jgi:hypothetical protein
MYIFQGTQNTILPPALEELGSTLATLTREVVYFQVAGVVHAGPTTLAATIPSIT